MARKKMRMQLIAELEGDLDPLMSDQELQAVLRELLDHASGRRLSARVRVVLQPFGRPGCARVLA